MFVIDKEITRLSLFKDCKDDRTFVAFGVEFLNRWGRSTLVAEDLIAIAIKHGHARALSTIKPTPVQIEPSQLET